MTMSIADLPEIDGQPERVNRVFEDVIRSIAANHPRDWTSWLPDAEFTSVIHDQQLRPLVDNNDADLLQLASSPASPSHSV